MDYTYYTDNYFGEKVSESDFPKYLVSSKAYLDYITFNKTSILIEELWIQDKVDMITCEIIDLLKENDDIISAVTVGQMQYLEAGIKTESIKSHSITYKEAKGNENLSLLYDTEKMIYHKIRRALLPTGLLHRGL